MVSIIVPVYNVEKKLSRCIESILNQTFKDIEIILVDDGSRDRSGEICTQYAIRDSRVVYINQINSGPSAARNKGLSVARGEYIQFVDSDDYIAVDMTEKLLKCMESENADVVMCGYKKILGEQENIVLPTVEKTFYVNEIDENYPDIFTTTLLNSPCNKLYRRNKLKEKFPEDLLLGEDLIFNLRNMIYCKKISCIKESLYYYVACDNSLTQGQYRLDGVEIAKRIYLEMKDFAQKLRLNANVDIGICNSFSLSLFYNMSDLFFSSSYDMRKKMEIMQNWLKDSCIQDIAKKAKFKKLKHKIALFFLRHHMKTGLCILFGLKGYLIRRCSK